MLCKCCARCTKNGLTWWSRLGSNQRPSACEADALPLSHGTGHHTDARSAGRTRSKIITKGRQGWNPRGSGLDTVDYAWREVVGLRERLSGRIDLPVCENGNHTPRHRNRTRFRDRTRGPSPVPTLTGARRRDLCGYARVDYRRPSQRATISLVARGCSAVGSAQPCQGWGRGFESRHPLDGARRINPSGGVAEW